VCVLRLVGREVCEGYHDTCHTRGWTSFRTEWVIWAENEWVAGCIDFAAVNAEGKMYLVDWKRSKGLCGPQFSARC
jgi:hypothetical protein